ncbi:MAG: hypothetical protein EP308_02795 [Burkholderiales bacterium]|nr:MAG: hypothetical protein EP308_02795 [Burkholderiales bacterium]
MKKGVGMFSVPFAGVRPRPALLTLVLAGLPLAVMAQHSVSVPVEIEHSSNPALTAVDEVGVTRLRVSPQYTIETQDGADLTRVSFGAVLERSSNTSVSDNRLDPNLSVAVERALPAGAIGMRFSLSESSTRVEEFTETGAVVADATQRNALLEGSWSRELTELSRMELGLGLAQVRYDSALFEGYRELRSSVGFSRDLGEDTRLSATLAASRFNPDDDLQSSSRRSLSVGVATRLSETLSLAAEAGVVRVSAATSESDPTASLRLNHVGERLSTGLEWSRTTAASGSVGGYSASQSLSWTAGYALSERSALNLSASRARSLEPGSAVGISVMLGLRRALSEFWSFEARLGQLQSRPVAGPTARATVAGLVLNYSHPDF